MIVGITGNIFCGKTTVAKIFKRKGAKIIDADKIAHRVLEQKIKKVEALFGKRITRKKIARLVFKNKQKLKQLTKILHPLIIMVIKKEIRKVKSVFPQRLIVVDAPLLVESGLYKDMDKNILVTSSKKIIFKRAKKFKMSKKEVISRLNCQLPDNKKMGFADFIIKNNAGLTKLRKEVDEIYKELR